MTEQIVVHSPEEPTTPDVDTIEEITVESQTPPESSDPSWEELRHQFKNAGRIALSGVVEVAKGTLQTSLVGAKIGMKATKDAKNWTSNKASEYKTHREERKAISSDFKKKLGKFALVALEEGNTKIDMPATSSFRQGLELKNVVRKLNKVEHKKTKAQAKKSPTHGTAPYGKARKETFLTRRSEGKDALAAYKAGEIDKNELLERQKRARELVVWQGSVRPFKAMRKAKRMERSLKNSLNLKDIPDSTDGQPAESPKIVARISTEAIRPSGVHQKEVRVTPTLVTPKISSLERLRKMRKEGLLPAAPVKSEATPTPPTAKPTESVVAAPETAAPAEKEDTSTEKLAEIAYITAKDEVFRLINEENDKRTASGKEQLTKEEKAGIWKKERAIRQSLLASLTPENRKLVNEQIGKLIEADREARKEGKEQLRDRRRREAREAEAKKRQDTQEAKRKTDQAKKDREKQAAAAVARNAAQTAIDS